MNDQRQPTNQITPAPTAPLENTELYTPVFAVVDDKKEVVHNATTSCHEAAQLETELTHGDAIPGEFTIKTLPEHNARLLPATALGRRQKAQREGWSQPDSYRAILHNRALVHFLDPTDNRRQPQVIRLRYVPQCCHWRCESTRGKFDENQTEHSWGEFNTVCNTAVELIK